MSLDLQGKRVAVLATDGVEQVELSEPVSAARGAGAVVDLISISSGQVQGFNHLEKGETFSVDQVVGDVTPDEYDALILPGGVANPDTLRTDADAVAFVRGFFQLGKPVAVICHGPWTLVEADVVRGRTLTSWPSLRTDIENAGGHWVDEPVHIDQGLITSRKPEDLPEFCSQMVRSFAGGRGADS